MYLSIIFDWRYTVIHIVLLILMIVMINVFGSIYKGYVTMDQLLSTTNLGYNLIYRILSPTIFISFATLVLEKIGLALFTKEIWLVAVYYSVISLLMLIIYGRFQLVNKILFFFIHISSIGLMIWVYQTALKFGSSAILPDAGNFRTEWWFIVLGYFYNLLNGYSPNYSIEYDRKNNFLLDKYLYLKRKYNNLLNNDFKTNKLLSLIFYSIMITEDINRPPFLRFLERIFFFLGKTKTTGIMQVTSTRYLSDEDSIRKAQKIILKSYKLNEKAGVNDEYQLVINIASDYNMGNYGLNISQIYTSLKSSKK